MHAHASLKNLAWHALMLQMMLQVPNSIPQRLYCLTMPCKCSEKWPCLPMSESPPDAGKAGDYLVKNYTDRDVAYPPDVWIVDQTLFKATYQTVAKK